MPIFFRGALLLALTTLGSTRIAASDRTWLQIRSPHFRVITDAGDKRGIEVAAHCEQMRAAFRVLMAKATADHPAPLLIFAVKSQQEVDDLAPNRGRKLLAFRHFFSRNRSKLYFARSFWRSVAHRIPRVCPRVASRQHVGRRADLVRRRLRRIFLHSGRRSQEYRNWPGSRLVNFNSYGKTVS
jgi:hypothetical protein